jgi:hypothetical protein
MVVDAGEDELMNAGRRQRADFRGIPAAGWAIGDDRDARPIDDELAHEALDGSAVPIAVHGGKDDDVDVIDRGAQEHRGLIQRLDDAQGDAGTKGVDDPRALLLIESAGNDVSQDFRGAGNSE